MSDQTVSGNPNDFGQSSQAAQDQNQRIILVDAQTNSLYTVDPATGNSVWIVDPATGMPMQNCQIYVDGATNCMFTVDEGTGKPSWIVDPTTGRPMSRTIEETSHEAMVPQEVASGETLDSADSASAEAENLKDAFQPQGEGSLSTEASPAEQPEQAQPFDQPLGQQAQPVEQPEQAQPTEEAMPFGQSEQTEPVAQEALESLPAEQQQAQSVDEQMQLLGQQVAQTQPTEEAMPSEQPTLEEQPIRIGYSSKEAFSAQPLEQPLGQPAEQSEQAQPFEQPLGQQAQPFEQPFGQQAQQFEQPFGQQAEQPLGQQAQPFDQSFMMPFAEQQPQPFGEQVQQGPVDVPAYATPSPVYDPQFANQPSAQSVPANPPFDIENAPYSGLAIAALVLGILAIGGVFVPVLNIVALVMAIVGLVLGIVGLKKINVGEKRGKGLAVAGIVLAVVSIIAFLVTTLVLGVLFKTAVDEGVVDVTPPSSDAAYVLNSEGAAEGDQASENAPTEEDALDGGYVEPGVIEADPNAAPIITKSKDAEIYQQIAADNGMEILVDGVMSVDAGDLDANMPEGTRTVVFVTYMNSGTSAVPLGTLSWSGVDENGKTVDILGPGEIFDEPNVTSLDVSGASFSTLYFGSTVDKVECSDKNSPSGKYSWTLEESGATDAGDELDDGVGDNADNGGVADEGASSKSADAADKSASSDKSDASQDSSASSAASSAGASQVADDGWVDV